MGPKPGPGYSIERVDNERGYELGNCIWATPKMQARNTRRNINIDIDGTVKTLAEWCEIYGRSHSTTLSRITRGWPAREAVVTPIRTKTMIEIDGITKTVPEWCALYNISRFTVYKRIQKGWRPQEAITTTPR